MNVARKQTLIGYSRKYNTDILEKIVSKMPIYQTYLFNETELPVLINFDDLYTKVKILGSGASGYVTCYLEKSTNIKYAMKELDITSVDMLNYAQDEANILKQIKKKICSDSIVKYYDSFIREKDGHLVFVIVTEYVEGITLAKYVEQISMQGEVLSINTILKISYWLYHILDLIHKANYVHRDIKPDNIMIDTNKNRLVLIDFGLTCSTNQKSKIICKMNFPGTPSFMPPEATDKKVQNKYKLDRLKMADIWAAGLTIYFIIEKRLPWTEFMGNKLTEQITGNFEIEYSLSDPISNILSMSLERNPDNRADAATIKNHIVESYRSFNTKDRSSSF